jgi:hypothetical protein
MWKKLVGRFSLESGHRLKVLSIIHVVIGGILFIITLLVNPIALICSAIPYASFQLFLLSWWLWRIPRIELFRTQVLPISFRRKPMTREQEEEFLHRAWRSRLLFIILWGWMCTVLFAGLAAWWVILGGCPWASVLLFGGLFTTVAGWILGSAWMLHHVYKG